jgi:hypothetical protein
MNSLINAIDFNVRPFIAIEAWTIEVSTAWLATVSRLARTRQPL